METVDMIYSLMTENGQTAAQLTHGLKELGGGDMQTGIARVGFYFLNWVNLAEAEGLSKGRFQGGATVALIGIAGIGVHRLIKRRKALKVAKENHIREGLAIQEALSKPVKETGKDTHSIGTEIQFNPAADIKEEKDNEQTP